MKIYAMNDCDWFMAPTLEEAIAGYGRYVGEMNYEADELLDDPHEVPPEELTRLQFCDDLYAADSPKRSFAEELARRVAEGRGPEFFATTEY